MNPTPTLKRKVCSICENSSHSTDDCPQLAEYKRSSKRLQITESAHVANNEDEEEEIPDVTPIGPGQVAPY